MSGWRIVGWGVALLVAVPSAAGAQRYSSRPNPASPDAYDRYQAKVDPAGATAVIGSSAIADALGFRGRPVPPVPAKAFSRKRYEQALAARRNGSSAAAAHGKTGSGAPRVGVDPADLASAGYHGVPERIGPPRLLSGIPAVVGAPSLASR